MAEISCEELKKQLEELTRQEQELDKEIAVLSAQGGSTQATQAEIQALHRYNDMKDLAQTVIDYLACAEQTTVAEIHNRFNLPLD